MKNGLRRIVCLTFVFIMLVSSFAFAGTQYGIEYFTSKSKAVDAGYDTDEIVSVKLPSGTTVYISEDDEEEWKENASQESSADKKALDKTLDEAIKDSKSRINDYGKIMSDLQPDPLEGWNMLGGNIKEGLMKIMSLAIVIFWIIYIAVLIWNGVNVLIPGMYDKTQGAAQSGNNDGVSKAAGFGQRFISKNSQEAVEQENQSKWIKKELKRLIMFAIITVGLLSGIFFNILGFILGMINFGG